MQAPMTVPIGIGADVFWDVTVEVGESEGLDGAVLVITGVLVKANGGGVADWKEAVAEESNNKDDSELVSAAGVTAALLMPVAVAGSGSSEAVRPLSGSG
jgi:hypothetical protein